MRKSTIYIVAVLAIISTIFIFSASTVRAGEGTVIGQVGVITIIQTDSVWTKQGSPYLINGPLYVTANLTVEPGVEIIGMKDSRGISGGELKVYTKGRLYLKGKRNDRIKISDLYEVQIYKATAKIENVDFSNITGQIYFYNAVTDMATSTIKNSNIALKISSSTVNMWGSRLDNNNYAIQVVENYKYSSSTVPSSVKIKINNNIIASSTVAINSLSYESMDFTNNWWGTSTGPSAEPQRFSYRQNSILYPWLTEEPEFDPEPLTAKPECCSSVLFIPGLQASRLFKDEGISEIGSTSYKLWEPMINGDVKALYMDSQGKSVDSSIYPGPPIDNVFGSNIFGTDIYGNFMDYLDSLKHWNMISDWKYFGYDWRQPIDSLVAGETKSGLDNMFASTSLLGMVQEMASSSPTGKVTLVAHSNGGLLMKYLVKTLTEMDRADIIDKAVSVAVPYLGTPKAILGLLHGYGQSMAKGIILKESVARGLGENMPSAYSLLPSVEYFKNIFSPTIVFASTTVAGVNNGSYPQSINSQESQSAFIEDKNSVRTSSAFSDTSRPIKGNGILNIAATYIHGLLDPFVWPANIAKYALVGWGQDTPTGIIYDNKQKCSGILSMKTCVDVPTYRALNTKNGDGTVVGESASYNDGTIIGLELGDGSPDRELKDKNHATILSADVTRKVVGEIITNGNSVDSQAKILQNISAISGVTIGGTNKGTVDQNTKQLIVSTHSPVRLDVYDEFGNHTGEMALPYGMDAGLYVAYDEQIPGSKYERTGDENEPDTYVTLPDDGRKYNISIGGTGTGEFTYDIERQRGDSIIEKVEYKGLPVTPLMVATTSIMSDPAFRPTTALASSSQVLSIDINGDSIVDTNIVPNNKPDPKMFLKLIRATLEKFGTKENRIKELLKKLENIEKLIEKGKLQKADKESKSIVKKIGHKEFKKLGEADRKEILDSIEMYLAQFK